MYNNTPQQISQSARATLNAGILSNIDNFSKEEIYNSYTGIGGLHGLKQADYASYNEYAKTKLLFPSDDALRKSVWLAIGEIEKKWTAPIRNWGIVMNQFIAIFENRIEA